MQPLLNASVQSLHLERVMPFVPCFDQLLVDRLNPFLPVRNPRVIFTVTTVLVDDCRMIGGVAGDAGGGCDLMQEGQFETNAMLQTAKDEFHIAKVGCSRVHFNHPCG